MITFVAADSSRYDVGGDAEQWNIEQLCHCPKDGQRHTNRCQLTGTCADSLPRLRCLLHMQVPQKLSEPKQGLRLVKALQLPPILV